MTYYHTRGPWTIHSRNAAHMSIAGPGTPEVATITFRHVSINEWKANGNLIAAAPDMLAALEVAEAHVSALAARLTEGLPITLDHFHDIHGARDDVRAAIAKATGVK